MILDTNGEAVPSQHIHFYNLLIWIKKNLKYILYYITTSAV